MSGSRKDRYQQFCLSIRAAFHELLADSGAQGDGPDDQDRSTGQVGAVWAEIRRVLTVISSQFSSTTRREQIRQISGAEQAINVVEQRMNRNFRIASANLGIATLSFFYPPLILLTILILIYSAIPFLQLAYYGLVKQRRVTSYLLDAILLIGMLLGGFFHVGVIGAWLATFGRKLLLQSENNAKRSLVNLFGDQPRTIQIFVDGKEVEIPFEQLSLGDIIILSAGQMIPVDGTITSGLASIDEHKLTGESQPAEKGVGDSVLASTVILAGKVYVRTVKTGQETVAMQIGQVLQQTATFKTSVQSRGEAIADRFVLPTLGLSILCLPLGASSALAILTNAFGYKMRLFAPASMLTFLNLASRQGILIKDGRSLEQLSSIDTVVFDKTGTLTLDEPSVAAVHVLGGDSVSEDDILRYAAAAEAGQTHPIARAILTATRQRKIAWPSFENARYEIGYGIQVNLSDRVIRVGSLRFIDMEGIAIAAETHALQARSHALGHSLVMVAFDSVLVGAIELKATVRPEAAALIAELHRRGKSVCIISGDQEAPTRQMADALEIDSYFANCLPEDKAKHIEALQSKGKSVCFVGDGINDSIAMKKANVSISLRGATTVATDTAQIVLMDGTLGQIGPLFELAVEFEENMRSNLLLSTIPSAVCVGGIIFDNWGVLIGTVITQATFFTGIGNSILPLLKKRAPSSLAVPAEPLVAAPQNG